MREYYSKVLDAYALGIQSAYSDYKQAMKDYLDYSWFDMDGELNFSVRRAAELTDAEEQLHNYIERMSTLKKLLEEGNVEKIDKFIEEENLC